MISAILTLAALGLALGFGLGVAAKKFAVEGSPIVEEVTAMMPGSQCGQCGFPGCAGAGVETEARAAACGDCRSRNPTTRRWSCSPRVPRAPPRLCR